MSWGGPAKIGCDGGVLLRTYVPPGIKRHKSYIKKHKPQDVVQNNSNETSQSFTTVGWRCAALAGVVVKLGRVCAQVQLIHGVVGAQVGAVGVGHRIVPVGLKLRRAVGDGVT